MTAIALVVSRWEWTFPNVITLGRMLICAWGLNVFYWWNWNPWLMLLFCGFGMALDGVDGWVARVTNQTSFSGQLLDPIVDKITAWNAVVTIAAWTVTKADAATVTLVLFCIPPVILIGIYDYMTMTLRSSDEAMATNPIAKAKQAVLFTSLACLLFCMYITDLYAQQRQILALRATETLLAIIGTGLMWQALRMTVDSARIYFQETMDPVGRKWSTVGWVRWILATF